jgi:hypothetical protein
MLSSKQKFRLGASFATLMLFAVGVGCGGFFVNPTITALAIGPQASIQQNGTVQMSAVATYNDGTQSTLTSGVFWSTSDTTIASVTTGGLVTGLAPGTATITGASGAVNGSTTVTVTLTGLTKITISPASKSITEGTSVQYTAIGTAQGQNVNISTEVTWGLDNDINGTVSIDNTGLLTTQSGSGPGTIHITATDPTTGIVSNTATLTVQ